MPDESFNPGVNDPAFVLIENNKITGASSLILHPEYRELKKGRFRIFHCIRKDVSCYSQLLENIIKCTGGIKNIYCFIQDTHYRVREIWEELGFFIERYSWILYKDIKDFDQASFPDGYGIKNIKGKKDEQAFCDIINIAFAEQAGHRYMRASMIDEIKKEEGYLSDGLLLLSNCGHPVGTMQLNEETENGKPVLFINALSILPEHKGKGLGKNMLRYALQYGKEKGYGKAILSVNAENEQAVSLYINEGFKKSKLYICYNMTL